MDNKKKVYIYNPFQPNKDIGRRTGIPILKKRNVCSNIDNFDDYLTDSEDEKSINVTKHMHQSVVVSAEVSYRQESATSPSKNKVAKATESCLQEGVPVNEPFLVPKIFGNVRVVNPLTAGSRFGRRTGKDILAKKATKVLPGDNFSDYLSDSSGNSESLHATQIQSSTVESPSTSAKESDGKLSPDRVHIDKSPLVYVPNSSITISQSGGNNMKSKTIIHESSKKENTTSVEIQFSNQSDHTMSAADLQHSNNNSLTEAATSGCTSDEGLQSQCRVEESAFMNNKRISLQSESDKMKLNNSRLKRPINDNAEETREPVYTSEVVNSFPGKENMILRSSPQARKLSRAGEVSVRASDTSDKEYTTDKSISKVNLGATQEESVDNRSYQTTGISIDHNPPTVYPFEVVCLVLDGKRKSRADCRAVKQFKDNEIQKNKKDSCSVTEILQKVIENKSNNSELKMSTSITNVHILDTYEGIRSENESRQLIGAIDVNKQSGTSSSLPKSPTATLNFGGDGAGSVSNTERAIAGHLFGIRKRLSYSSALLDSEEQKEKHSKVSTQSKMLQNVEKRSTHSVGSFVDHHSQIRLDISSTSNRVSGTLFKLASQNVSRLVKEAKQMEPLGSLNTSTDSIDEFCILEDETTDQSVSKVGRSKKTVGSNNSRRKTTRNKNNNEKSKLNQTKKDEGERNAKSSVDIEMANELSGKQDEILLDSHVGSKRKIASKLTKGTKLIASPMVSSFVDDHHDELSLGHPETVSETSNLISLAPRRVSQLVTGVKKVKLLESLGTSTDSSDDVHVLKIVNKPKAPKTLKRNHQIQEVNNKTGRRKINISKKNETSQAKGSKEKTESDIEIDDNCELDSSALNNDNRKVSNNKKAKQSKAIITGQEIIDENEATNVHYDTKEKNMTECGAFQEIHETHGKHKKMSKIKAKQDKVDDSKNMKTVKQLKDKTKDLKIDLCRSLVHEHHEDDNIDVIRCLPSQNDIVPIAARSTNTVIIDNNSNQNEIHSRQMPELVQSPVDTPGKKQAAAKVKKGTFHKNKNQKRKKSWIKTTGAKRNYRQIKTSPDSSPAKHKLNNLNISSGTDNINMNDKEQNSDSSSIKSNNAANSDGHADKENSGNNYSNVENSVHLDTESCTDDQQCDLKKYIHHLSPLKELEIILSRSDISVPVKLSTQKTKIAARLSSVNRKRKPSLNRKKESSLCSTRRDDESTPVKLQLISSLPKVTPQSGISFIRSCGITSVKADAGKHGPAAGSISEDWEDEEHFTPLQKKKQAPRMLSSCLRKRDSVNPRRKARRVRISNFIDQKECSQDESTDFGSAETTTHLPTPSSSPVHYCETTTMNVLSKSKIPKIVLPDLSYKIIRPSNVPTDGLRRSSRTKVMRINAHKGEEIIYRRDSTGFGLVVDSIQPSIGEAKVKAAEAERRRKLIERKSKAMKVPAKPPKRLSTHWNVDQDVPSITEVPVVNPDNNEEVLLELIARNDSASWYGPDLDPVTGTEPIALCLHLKQPMFTTGTMHMRALAEKPYTLTEHTLIYIVIYGKIHLKINDVSTTVETGDNFFIPRGTRYSLKNLRREIAKLHFVDMDDSPD